MSHDVIIMGCRGYTRNYGGWETLVHNLIDNWPDKTTRFFVLELSHDPNEKAYEVVRGVHCIRIFVRRGGSAEMLIMDTLALARMKKIILEYGIQKPILLDLGVRFGEMYWFVKHTLNKLGVVVVSNTDGMGWKRTKYSKLIAYRNRLTANIAYHAGVDCLVNDCEVMQEYYEHKWRHWKHRPLMRMIPYGPYEAPKLSSVFPEKVKAYFDAHGIVPGQYYLMINRFVPENSYEMIISEYVASETPCDFIIVCNKDHESAYYQKLAAAIPFEADKRIKFVGTMYDKEILAYLRQNARGYINGHTLGGTNPGLLEALATTNVNLVRDCSFSREGAADTALYFSEAEPLRDLLKKSDAMTDAEREALGTRAKARMRARYTWDGVCRDYYELFEEIGK